MEEKKDWEELVALLKGTLAEMSRTDKFAEDKKLQYQFSTVRFVLQIC
jgi:hypothetical protein